MLRILDHGMRLYLWIRSGFMETAEIRQIKSAQHLPVSYRPAPRSFSAARWCVRIYSAARNPRPLHRSDIRCRRCRLCGVALVLSYPPVLSPVFRVQGGEAHIFASRDDPAIAVFIAELSSLENNVVQTLCIPLIAHALIDFQCASCVNSR